MTIYAFRLNGWLLIKRGRRQPPKPPGSTMSQAPSSLMRVWKVGLSAQASTMLSKAPMSIGNPPAATTRRIPSSLERPGAKTMPTLPFAEGPREAAPASAALKSVISRAGRNGARLVLRFSLSLLTLPHFCSPRSSYAIHKLPTWEADAHNVASQPKLSRKWKAKVNRVEITCTRDGS